MSKGSQWQCEVPETRHTHSQAYMVQRLCLSSSQWQCKVLETRHDNHMATWSRGSVQVAADTNTLATLRPASYNTSPYEVLLASDPG